MVIDSVTGDQRELNEKHYRLYVCGPTVYGDPHIGNVRPLVTFDVLVRFLKAKGITVAFVHNITDVDDKIINRAMGEKVSEKVIADRYYAEYVKIANELRSACWTSMPKVTDHIEGIVAYVQKIIDKDYAYVADGSVYFRVHKSLHYGEISGRKLTDLPVEETERNGKENPQDFALWKKSSVGVNWPSPWGMGRPGWHTECSYFINTFFKDQVDIHGGGIDLKFPHHENENAQNLAVTGLPISKIWMHTGHIVLNEMKMSKSIGNTIYAKDAISKYGARALRWLMYSTAYTKPVDYSPELMTECKKDVTKVLNAINTASLKLAMAGVQPNLHPDQAFMDCLDDDLNFPNAVSRINELVYQANLDGRKADPKPLQNTLGALLHSLEVFGLWDPQWYEAKDLALINDYKVALANRDFAASDRLRKTIRQFV